MSGYTVLATRYRPRRFDDVVGQEDAARVLRAAVAGDRSAHAYLFSGPRGVGKTSMARILAKAWNCLENAEGDPCGRCSICRAIDEGGDALDVVEIDGASHNKVENVRDLIDTVRFRPVEARHRVYIVDEVHMLSTSAFNALLKTLEEPPSHAKFILATTEPLKVPETIRSRCQLIDFRRLGSEEIAGRLRAVCESEAVPVPAGLPERIARHARGGLRDALSLLDQLITFGDGKPTLADFERLTGRLAPELLHDLVAGAIAGDSAAALAGCERALSAGARPADLLDQLAEVLEGVLVTVAGGRPADRTGEEVERLAALAAGANLDQVVAMLDTLIEAQQRLRQRHEARLVVEMAVLTLSRLRLLESLSELLASGATPQPAGGGPHASAALPRAASGTGPASRAAPPAGGGSRGARSVETADPVAREAAREPAAAAPAGGVPVSLAERFIEEAAKGARSLRAELQRYRSIRLEGDELVLAPPPDASAAWDPSDPELRQRLEAAARRVLGRPVALRLERSVDGTARERGASGGGASGSAIRAPGPAAAASPGDAPSAPPARGRRGASTPLDARILGDWPGAEPVDI